ncbi:SDR family NAD(P)-dependent oxidoreductase [Saccharopolyspora mangrovi]|uniref:SDR family NAD(P)-dependent oxidoreductase n=1 Tax=Saccharopolyspora mangrovi TaxID=3082379 RepID=A0ABU6AJS7_9PSEU|nr:SDR family NAD(P)-dependent oxidoreductase [Saccharopolyspora sp. S2-29]MEB3371780.1 SDR family NAD(P)-dependent oxidoreductase [Saccharopolyspora sp. S2-29]
MSSVSNLTARDDGLAGKVAVITGGASGIGRALALAYARAGVTSILGYHPGDPHDPTAAVADVESAGGRALAIPADVSDPAAVRTLVETAIGEFGRLDIAVANAGILRRAPISEMTDERWDDMLSVDLTGVLRLVRSAAEKMGEGGAMVAVSSIAGGVYGWGDHAHYAAAKSGVLGLIRSVSVELAPRGIRANAVIPGLIETPQSLDADNSLGPDGLAKAGRSIPTGRVGRADEVARTIRFLTSDDASYITGQQVIVDGGLTVRFPD